MTSPVQARRQCKVYSRETLMTTVVVTRRNKCSQWTVCICPEAKKARWNRSRKAQGSPKSSIFEAFPLLVDVDNMASMSQFISWISANFASTFFGGCTTSESFGEWLRLPAPLGRAVAIGRRRERRQRGSFLLAVLLVVQIARAHRGPCWTPKRSKVKFASSKRGSWLATSFADSFRPVGGGPGFVRDATLEATTALTNHTLSNNTTSASPVGWAQSHHTSNTADKSRKNTSARCVCRACVAQRSRARTRQSSSSSLR
mmetsp:Transcript_92652/g.266445  ORF Transcript_92652/g.266445 Transcript_92652/m.266445 type:complete len:258 (-) Transcript_92652:256-1029(-)